MMDRNRLLKFFGTTLCLCLLFLTACEEDEMEPDNSNPPQNNASDVVFLLIDEESIDNGNPPNDFSDVEVNDQLARIGLRSPLAYFQDNVGSEITLYTGQVGDEGWFAIKTIPSSWKSAGPTDKGSLNFLEPGPGLGAPNPDDDREVLLDEIPDITPLRAEGLSMLVGQTILAVVYDSDISINYSPLQGNLMGSNLGIVAFDVLGISERTDGSDSSLPQVRIQMRDATQIASSSLVLFSNAPIPQSSSEPFDIRPPSNFKEIILSPAE